MLSGSGFVLCFFTCLFLFFTEVSVTNFPTVPSSTIFWKQHVLVACMILLVLLPSALTRLRGSCPRAFLWWREDLLLPQAPGWPRGNSESTRISAAGAPPQHWCPRWDGDRWAPQLSWGRSMDCVLRIPRAAASVLQLGNFNLSLLKSFCSQRFQVKCVSAHFSWEGRFTYALGSFYQNTHTAMTHLIDNVLSDG